MKMKRIFAAALSLCMALTLLAGCQSGGNSTGGSTSGGNTGSGGSGASSSGGSETVDWPKDNINLIVPFAAGGGMDLTGRLAAMYLEQELGVTVTVNNVEGGNSWTGWTQVIQAEGDGYTLGMANYPQCVGGYLNPSSGIPFTYKDFSYIANIVSDPTCCGSLPITATSPPLRSSLSTPRATPWCWAPVAAPAVTTTC